MHKTGVGVVPVVDVDVVVELVEDTDSSQYSQPSIFDPVYGAVALQFEFEVLYSGIH